MPATSTIGRPKNYADYVPAPKQKPRKQRPSFPVPEFAKGATAFHKGPMGRHWLIPEADGVHGRILFQSAESGHVWSDEFPNAGTGSGHTPLTVHAQWQRIVTWSERSTNSYTTADDDDEIDEYMQAADESAD